MKRLALCFTMIVSVAAVGCDGHTSLDGIVVGPDDKPLAGVRVGLHQTEGSPRGSDMTTDETGWFHVGFTHALMNLTFVVDATKKGYKPFRKEFKAKERYRFPEKIVSEADPQAPARD